MKIGTNCPGLIQMYGRLHAYEMLKEAGFDCVDQNDPMYEYKPFTGLFAAPEKEFIEFFAKDARALKKAGLTCGQLHVPFPTYPDRKEGVNWDEEFKFMVNAIKKSFRAAREVGASYAVLHPLMRCGWGKDDNERLTFCMNEVLFADLLEAAEKQGVKIALENMPNAWVPTATPESLIAMIDGIKSENFVACLDTGHACISGVTPADFARALGDRVKVLHVHDNDGKRDLHDLPFTGVTDWVAFGKALKEINYQGDITLEAIFHKEDLEKDTVGLLKRAAEAAKKIAEYAK